MPDGDNDELDPAFYEHGGVSLSEEEQAALGNLTGKRVLQLGAGNGEDALSLVNLGAEVTVVDEVEMLVEVKALAQASHVRVRFVEGSYADPPSEVRTGGFDGVYSGFGGVGWIPDLDAWAAAVYTTLEKDGFFLLYDEHPIALTVGAAGQTLEVVASYFAAQDDSEDGGHGDDVGGPQWTLGEIVTALIQAGFAIDLLVEFPESERFATVLDDLADTVPPEILSRVPGVFLLMAHRRA